MVYEYTFTIPNVIYLDHLIKTEGGINSIVDPLSIKVLYENSLLTINFIDTPSNTILNNLTSFLETYIPVTVYVQDTIDLPEKITLLSARDASIGTLQIYNTNNSYGLGSSGSLNVYGETSILGKVYLGNSLDLNYNVIQNVTAPNLSLDVANKYYVDSRFDNFTASSNINGNFTQGQVIIGGTLGNSLIGYPYLTLNNGILNLSNTDAATSLSSGGVLNIAGGVTINKNLYIGTGLDVNNTIIKNVSSPLNLTDGVNKQYVDFFLGINQGDIYETTFVLSNNINVPTNISQFIFNNSVVSSFDATVYLEIPSLNKYDQYILHGLLKGSTWIINSTFIGDNPSRITFSIINTGTHGQVQYTNTNLSGVATIRFRAKTTSQGNYINIINTSSSNLVNTVPGGGTGTDFFTQGTLLIGNGSDFIDTSSDLMYLNNTLYINNTASAISLTNASVIFSGGISIQKNLLVGSGIDLNMQKITNVTTPSNLYDVANKYYVDNVLANNTNSNMITTNLTSSNILATNITTTNLYTNSVNMTPSLGDIFHEISFNASHNVNTPVDITGLLFNSNVRYFTAWLSVFIVASINVTSAFTIEGIQLNGEWKLNTRFIGSNTRIQLSITNTGQIQYTCPSIFGFVSSVMKFRAVTTSI